MNAHHAIIPVKKIASLRNSIWILGMSAWVFGVVERSLASFSDGNFSSTDATQLLTASMLLLAWLWLKPVYKLSAEQVESEYL